MILKRKLLGLSLEEYWFDHKGWLRSSADICALRTNENSNYASLTLPEKTLVIQLDRTKEDIFSRIQPRTRNYIKRELKELTVHLAENEEDRKKFYTPYEAFARERKLGLPNWKEEEDLEIYLAENKMGELLHGLAFFPSKDGTNYRYRYGIRIKKSHANALLFWKAIENSKARGFRTFDLGGVPQDPDSFPELKGVYNFKTHFGGIPVANFLHIKSNRKAVRTLLWILSGVLKREQLKKKVLKLMTRIIQH